MLQVALLAMLSTAPVQTVALPGFTVSGVDPSIAGALTDRFATELGRDGALKVISQRDLTQLLGLDRQRALLGCAEGASACSAEMAAALGADLLITGSILAVGSRWTLTLRVLSAAEGKVVFSDSARVASLDAAQDWLDQMALQLRERRRGVPSAAPAPAPRWPRWLVVAAGGAAFVAGVSLFAASKGDAGTLRGVMLGDTTAVAAVRSSGQTKETVGLVLGGAGLAVLAAGLAWALWPSGPAPQTQVSVALAPFGATLVIGGGWP